MNVAGYLNPVRIWHLFKLDFNSKLKDYIITVGAVFGVFLLIMLITSKVGELDYAMHYAWISIILFIFGFIFISSSFRAAHKKLLNHDWLMLPASILEKFLEKLLLYTLLVPVISIVLYWVFNFFALLVIRVIFGEYYPIFNIADSMIWKMFGHYIIASSVYLLGAAWFKNNNFIKTIVALVVFSMILSILSSLIGWLVFNDYFWPMVRGDFNFNYDFSHDFDTGRLESLGHGIVYLFKVIYFGLLAPVCWFGAWLKLREVEVKDGV